MRHMKRGRKLNRTNTHRKAMFRNMVTSLMRHQRIVTTLAKAKELRGVADRVITYAKKGSLHHRRLAARLINDPDVLWTVFSDYAERYAERPGGYTRIMKLGWRQGDAAPMAIIELMPEGTVGTKKRRRKSPVEEAVTSAEVTSKESFSAEAEASADAALDAEAEAAITEAPAEAEAADEALDAEADAAVEAPAVDETPAEEAAAEAVEAEAVEAPADEAAAEAADAEAVETPAEEAAADASDTDSATDKEDDPS